jgi:hypothetical protein
MTITFWQSVSQYLIIKTELKFDFYILWYVMFKFVNSHVPTSLRLWDIASPKWKNTCLKVGVALFHFLYMGPLWFFWGQNTCYSICFYPQWTLSTELLIAKLKSDYFNLAPWTLHFGRNCSMDHFHEVIFQKLQQPISCNLLGRLAELVLVGSPNMIHVVPLIHILQSIKIHSIIRK